jgi:hypothetical protein
MKNKIVILFALLTFTCSKVWSQDTISTSEGKKNKVSIKDTVQFQNAIQEIIDQDKKYIAPGTRNAVSAYTFSNIIQNDFLTLTGTNTSTTVAQYASLNVQPGNTALAFSPYVYYPHDLTNHPFKDVIAVNITGSVDATTNLFDFKNWRTLNGSFTWSHLINSRLHYWHDSIQQYPNGNRPEGILTYEQYYRIYAELCHEFEQQDRDIHVNELTPLRHPEFLDKDKLQKAFRDSVSKYEQLLTADHWTVKEYQWFKITANALSFDNANYIVIGDTASYDNPKSKGIWTPSVNLSYNFFVGWKSGWNLYLNAYTQVGLKDQYTEVYTPATYNSFHPLSDTSFIQKQNEQIFESVTDNVGTKLLPDFGAEGVLLFPTTKIGSYGLDVLYSHDNIISNKNPSSGAYLSTTMVGIVISLTDKTGLPTVNFEPYFQYKCYFNETIPNTHLWGAKLTVPISRVF